MLKLVSLLCLSMLMSVKSHAEVFDISVGTQYWDYDLKGNVRTDIAAEGSVNINFKDNSNVDYFIIFEHAVPYWPNLKIKRNNIQSDGLMSVRLPDVLSGNIARVNADINLSHTDVVLYYELMDSWVNLDLGLSAKYFNGHNRFKYVLLDYTLYRDDTKFSDWLPMLYLQTQFELPLTGLSAKAAVESITFDRNRATNFELSLQYQNSFGLAADIGYRKLDVNLKNYKNFKSDLKANGYYLGVNYSF